MAKKKTSKKKATKKVKKTKKSATKKATRRKSTAKKASTKKSRAKTSTKARKAKTRKKAITSPLSKSQLKEFRISLVEKRRELIGDMSGIEADALGKFRNNSEAVNTPSNTDDLGSDNYEQEFTLGLLESERILLAEINEALERIDNNIFGICLGTGNPIGEPRLRARPWSKYCIEYQRMLEKGLVNPDDDEFDFGLGDDEDEDDKIDEDEADIDDLDDEDIDDDSEDEDNEDEDY